MLTTLPNLLTFSRIVAIPLVIATFYMASPLGPWLGCAIFSLAAVTDWLDGRLARMWEQQSELGRFLDPVADKLLVATTLFMLAAYDRLSMGSILPALVILTREIMVSGLREHLAGLRVGMPVSKLAKWKTFIQMVAIGFLLVGDAGPAAIPVRAVGELLLWIAAVLTVKTGYDYLRAGLTHINRPMPQGRSIKTIKPSAT
ncbi:MAG: CDP-diacylglycerol--glycerol-3-phosphate 3-phosphatidyltransferase [Alphaproteobacteria bacterium]|nr:CDP-diacylglycerol--glycerol-3-phosphate 3-phosphatidyltransferase [Alphaproteobacteria bacterium]